MRSVYSGTGPSMNFTRDLYERTLPSDYSFIEKPRFREVSMELETLRESSITAETDAVKHLNIMSNWTTEMQQSFPDQHKNLLEDIRSRDAILSASSSFWVTVFFLLIFAFVFILLSLSYFVFVMISTIIVIAYVVGKRLMSYVDGYAETFVISTFDNCDIFYYSIATTKVREDMRSRYAKYVYCNYSHVRICKQRDREPSRLPVRRLKRLKMKSKKLRDIAYDYLR